MIHVDMHPEVLASTQPYYGAVWCAVICVQLFVFPLSKVGKRYQSNCTVPFLFWSTILGVPRVPREGGATHTAVC